MWVPVFKPWNQKINKNKKMYTWSESFLFFETLFHWGGVLISSFHIYFVNIGGNFCHAGHISHFQKVNLGWLKLKPLRFYDLSSVSFHFYPRELSCFQKIFKLFSNCSLKEIVYFYFSILPLLKGVFQRKKDMICIAFLSVYLLEVSITSTSTIKKNIH